MHLSVLFELRRQEGNLMSCYEVFNYFLGTYATDDIIADADMNIMSFKQPTGQDAVEYTQALWREALCCDPYAAVSSMVNISSRQHSLKG